MPEFFPGVHVRKVDFDGWNSDGRYGVPQCNASVSVGGRVEYDGVKFALGLLYPGYQFAFQIGLPELHFRLEGTRPFPDHPLDIRKRRVAINVRFTMAQQVQVWTIEEEEFHRGREPIGRAMQCRLESGTQFAPPVTLRIG